MAARRRDYGLTNVPEASGDRVVGASELRVVWLPVGAVNPGQALSLLERWTRWVGQTAKARACWAQFARSSERNGRFVPLRLAHEAEAELKTLLAGRRQLINMPGAETDSRQRAPKVVHKSSV